MRLYGLISWLCSCCGFVLFILSINVATGSYPDRILLRDIQVLTLHQGGYTNARRSSPIPQLKCVGGTAGCSTFVPQVVQCYNRGHNGYDVQWECKTDMDQKYRFGEIEVSCEGYDYPNDPYVVGGSCGLEYSLDLTGAGAQQSQYYNYQSQYKSSHNGFTTGTLVVLAIVCFVIYVVYKWLSVQNPAGQGYRSSYSPPPGGFASPPPPGFRPEYMPGSDNSGCYSSSTYAGQGVHNNAGTGGGFWTGAATGGILGYLFGSRNNTGTHYYQQPRYSSGWGSSGWGSSGFGSTSYSSSSTFGSGSRTASGFGGTKRR